MVLLLKGAVEQHVAASACAGDLAAERAVLAGGLVRLVDEFIGDARRHLLLLLPGGAQELAEVVAPPLKQRVLHLDRELLAGAQALERALVAALPALGLVLDDLRRGAG